VKAKNKEGIDMDYLLGINPKYSVDERGWVPSSDFLEYYRAVGDGRRMAYQSRQLK
jgi:hypothetical protein